MCNKFTHPSAWPSWVPRSTPENVGLNHTSCLYELYFLDFENDKVRKKTIRFLIDLSQNCLKTKSDVYKGIMTKANNMPHQ